MNTDPMSEPNFHIPTLEEFLARPREACERPENQEPPISVYICEIYALKARAVQMVEDMERIIAHHESVALADIARGEAAYGAPTPPPVPPAPVIWPFLTPLELLSRLGRDDIERLAAIRRAALGANAINWN